MLSALTTFAQDYTLYDAPSSGSTPDASMLMSVPFLIASFVLVVLIIIAMWKVYTKAGKPGWAALVPIYNLYVFMQIIGRPWWWMLLYLLGVIPFVGAVISFVVGVINSNDLAKSFGRGTGFTVLIVLLPFIAYPILAWGKDEYKGPAALEGNNNGAGTIPDAPYPTKPPTPPAPPIA